MLHNEVVELLKRLDDLYRAFGCRDLREVETAIGAIKVQADTVRGDLLKCDTRLVSRQVVNRLRVADEVGDDRPPLSLAPGVVIDWQNVEVRGLTRTVRPSPTEWLILKRLTDAAGSVVSDSVLIPDVWGERPVRTHILRVNIQRLKDKLSLAGCRPSIIERRNGVGYRLVLPAQARSESAA